MEIIQMVESKEGGIKKRKKEEKKGVNQMAGKEKQQYLLSAYYVLEAF